MSKEFIKLQLFGEGTPDPQQNPGQSSPEQHPQPAPDDALNDAERLLQLRQDIEKNYVPRSELEEEKAKSNRFLAAIWKNREGELPEIKERERMATKDLEKLIDDTVHHSQNMTDLQYITNVLEIRRAKMARGEPDPFAPANLTKENPYARPNPSDEDLAIAQEVADGLQACVDEANGDNATFLLAYQKYAYDAPRATNYRRR